MQGQGSAELLDKITQEAIALPLKIFMYHPPWESVEYVAGRGTRGQDSKGLFHKPSTTSQHMADGRTPRLPAVACGRVALDLSADCPFDAQAS